MFEFEEIEHFLPSTAINSFKNNISNFNTVRDSVMEIIKSYISVDPNQPFPDYLRLPSAWLCSYINFQSNSKTEKEEIDRYEYLFQKAIALLTEIKKLSVSKSAYSTNEIEGLL